MAEFETPPTFPGVKYDVTPMNIGEGYAKGITAAGEGIAKGITGALDVVNQNRNVDDTLLAMHQTGVLSPEAYQAVAGKSLGAKQTMLGMYASQWIAKQAQERELQKIGYTGATTAAVEQAKIAEAISAIRSGYPGAAGVNTRNILAQPGATAGQPAGTPSGQPQPTPNPTIAPTGQPGAGAAFANPVPMRYQGGIQPGPQIGTPVGPKDTLPPGSTLVLGTGPKGQTQHFVKLPDGTLRPVTQQ